MRRKEKKLIKPSRMSTPYSIQINYSKSIITDIKNRQLMNIPGVPIRDVMETGGGVGAKMYCLCLYFLKGRILMKE